MVLGVGMGGLNAALPSYVAHARGEGRFNRLVIPLHVVITDCNGFIGSHITALFRENGVEIRAPDSRALDVSDLPALCAAFQGAEVVIHNAALVKDWGSRERFFAINVRGTENVLAACRENSVQHVILTGSCSVFGEEHQPTLKDEQSPRNSHYPYFLDRIFPSAMNH
ncbi:MAG: NAD(P)-dependent oxidoreductase, partial [Azoarcus sp.]|nr:NAD(P)-dependent oxidoreductase [Azoarcus sp.]